MKNKIHIMNCASTHSLENQQNSILKPTDNVLKLENQLKESHTTFQATMKLPILIGQIFGLNPVLGVTDVDASKLRFKYLSGRCIYTCITIFCQILFLHGFFFIQYINNYASSITFNIGLVFHTTTTTTTIIFLRIARKWPTMCKYISSTETADPLIDKKLVRKCTISCFVVLFLAIVEHSLYELSEFVIAAELQPNNIYKTFIDRNLPWIINQLNHSYYLGILMQLVNIQCTFNWNFSDLFVICISFYLTARLEHVNKRIADSKGKNMPPIFWKSVRENYNRVVDLVRRVDEMIGSIICISFVNNLFSVCVQLSHMLANGIRAVPASHFPDTRPLQGYENAIYLIFSLIYLIGKFSAVCLIASEVHTASRTSLYVLYEVPSATYCDEVQRLIELIHGETVALSGLLFFKIKRVIVLAIFGTIVTYVLVLLEFAGITPAVSSKTN